MITANGYVYGRNWEFGYNIYPATTLIADTYTELKQQILDETDLGVFDSGMGYETVMGVHYTDIIESIKEKGWTKTRNLKSIKVGKLKGKKDF